MKKLMRLLALTLATAMLLSVGALAAENEDGEEAPKELWYQWLDWEEPIKAQEDGPYGGSIQMEPGERSQRRMIFYTCDWNENGEPVLEPVPTDKLVASPGLTLSSLALRADGKDKLKDCYTKVVAADWNKEYTISYGDYSITIESQLPDIGFYSKPEATIENYILYWLFGTAPYENESIYMISTATDETHGRHLADAALAKGVDDNKIFTMEKVSDSVYKLTRTCGVNVDELRPLLELTWQEGEGGDPDPYTENRDFFGWAHSSIVVSEDPLPPRDREDPVRYDDVKDTINTTLTMKAGEEKVIYATFNYFDTEHEYWTLAGTNANLLVASDSAMTLTGDSEDFSKLTVRCDVPGTYTITFQEGALSYPEVHGLYHADGTKYTDEELEKWNWETPYMLLDGELMIFTDLENDVYAPFEEVFPGEKVDFDIVTDPDHFPVTITVTGEAAAPAFSDVSAASWYAPAVSFANRNGYMNGNPDGGFDPTGRIKGTEFAQILYNKEGKPAAAEGAAFQGVSSQWYAAPVLWAAGKGIITDAGDAAMVPTEDLTRQQIALMLYNYMGQPEGHADLSGFTDADKVSAWALDAMRWAVSAGVLQGSGNALDPAGTATRAQTAQILMNFFG